MWWDGSWNSITRGGRRATGARVIDLRDPVRCSLRILEGGGRGVHVCARKLVLALLCSLRETDRASAGRVPFQRDDCCACASCAARSAALSEADE